MSRWLICAGLTAAFVFSQGTAQAEPAYCPAIKLDDGMSIQLYEVTYEVSDVITYDRTGPKGYSAFWSASNPGHSLYLVARFDVSGRPMSAPNRLRMSVWDPISRFGTKASDLDLVLKVQGVRPWRGKLPPARPPMPGSQADAFIDASDRPDLIAAFAKARTASLSVVTKSGKVLDTASFNLPSQDDWRGLSDGVASTLAKSRSEEPCRLSEMHVLADGRELVAFHGPPPAPIRLPPPHP